MEDISIGSVYDIYKEDPLMGFGTLDPWVQYLGPRQAHVRTECPLNSPIPDR